MVHSTTSSHYSIFRQRIPDYDLKLVRHYFQFKNRLEGMELCLEQVKRDVHHKEVRSAECFSKLTMILKRLMDEFASNKELMALVSKWYDLYAEWDKLTTKRIQIQETKDGKLELLHRLQDEYRELNDETRSIGRRLDHKLALGQKIASLKMELDKSVEQSMQALQERIQEISDPISGEMKRVSDQIEAVQSQDPKKWHIPDDIVTRIQDELNDNTISQVQKKAQEIVDQMREKTDGVSDPSESSFLTREYEVGDSTESELESTNSMMLDSSESQLSEEDAPKIDTTRLHRLVVQSERWRNYSFNIGYELSQFKKMVTMCEDATIKVRRLLHNFEERMKDTQVRVWDENYQLRPDFDFKDISVAGLRDVILLHDWWAANAPGKTPAEMGMTDEEFKAFKRRCNKVSYNLRKNQYTQLLAVRKDRTQRRISEIEDIIADKDTLHWDDKYGTDAQKGDGEEKWTVEKVDAKARARIKLIAQAGDIIDESGQKQYRDDSKKLAERTMNYLKFLGLAQTEADLERLALVNASSR